MGLLKDIIPGRDRRTEYQTSGIMSPEERAAYNERHDALVARLSTIDVDGLMRDRASFERELREYLTLIGAALPDEPGAMVFAAITATPLADAHPRATWAEMISSALEVAEEEFAAVCAANEDVEVPRPRDRAPASVVDAAKATNEANRLARAPFAQVVSDLRSARFQAVVEKAEEYRLTPYARRGVLAAFAHAQKLVVSIP